MHTPVKELTFIELLKVMDGNNSTVQDITDAISRVSKAVIATGNKGSITLKINVAKVSGDQLQLVEEVKFTEPAKKRDPNIMFTTDEGGLTRQDPKQLTLTEVKL